MKLSPAGLFTACAGLAVVAALVAGFTIIGSPETARLRRLDIQRVYDLRSLSNAIEIYWRNHARLPASLNDLQDVSQWTALRVTDAVSGQPYDYRIKEGAAYELCAQFDTALTEKSDPTSPAFWRHDRGRQCFGLEAKPPAAK